MYAIHQSIVLQSAQWWRRKSWLAFHSQLQVQAIMYISMFLFFSAGLTVGLHKRDCLFNDLVRLFMEKGWLIKGADASYVIQVCDTYYSKLIQRSLKCPNFRPVQVLFIRYKCTHLVHSRWIGDAQFRKCRKTSIGCVIAPKLSH